MADGCSWVPVDRNVIFADAQLSSSIHLRLAQENTRDMLGEVASLASRAVLVPQAQLLTFAGFLVTLLSLLHEYLRPSMLVARDMPVPFLLRHLHNA